MKNQVKYVPMAGDSIVVGRGALIMCPKNHPSDLVSNEEPIYTSDVLRAWQGEDGVCFETRNSVYTAVAE